MHNNLLNTDVSLYGEYRLRVVEGTETVSDTGWCKNTILSGGLVSLSSFSISDALYYLDLGTSNTLPGIDGYRLGGVLTKSVNSEFTNVLRDSLQTFTDLLSTKVYIAGFSSEISTASTETLREFSIKTINGVGFSRNVFPSSVTVNYNQGVNFEYRLSLGWNTSRNVVVPFKTRSGDTLTTFYIPTTSASFNIPYDRVYYSNNKLILLKNSNLPKFGDNISSQLVFAFNNKYFSTFNPTVISSTIDHTNKQMNVFEEYQNITAPDLTGVIDDINIALLVKDGETSIPSNNFLATKFAYPITIYNYNNIEDINIIPVNNSGTNISLYNKFKQNVMSLCYRYAWTESTSNFQNIVTNITEYPKLTSACTSPIINCNTTVSYSGDSSDNGYTINFATGSTKGKVSLTFNTTDKPTRFRVVYNNVEVINTGYRGNTAYNNILRSLGYPNISGPNSGILTFNKNIVGVNTAQVLVDTPLNESSWSFNLGCVF